MRMSAGHSMGRDGMKPKGSETVSGSPMAGHVHAMAYPVMAPRALGLSTSLRMSAMAVKDKSS